MANSRKLENKTAVITGENSGIGSATAKFYKAQGANVVITSRSEDSFSKAKSEYCDMSMRVMRD